MYNPKLENEAPKTNEKTGENVSKCLVIRLAEKLVWPFAAMPSHLCNDNFQFSSIDWALDLRFEYDIYAQNLFE